MLKNRDRLFWSLLSKIWRDWRSELILVKPEIVIPWRERKFREFICWYNHGRAHRGMNGIPDPDPVLAEPKPSGGRLVAIPVWNGLNHDYRLAA